MSNSMTVKETVAFEDSPGLVDRDALGRMIAPVRNRLLLGAGLSALSVPLRFLPYVSVVEIARVLLTDSSLNLVWLWAAIGAAGTILGFVVYNAALTVCHTADAHFKYSIRSRIARHLSRVPLGWFANGGTGEVKQAMTDDVKRMHLLVAHLPADVVPAILSPIVALIYLVAMDWKFSLVLVGYIGVCLALAAPSMRRAYRTNVDSWNLAMSTLTSATVELGDGIEVVKTYGSGSRAFARYSSAVDSMVAVCVRWMSGMGRPVVAMSILLSPAVLIVVITATGTAMLSGGWITPVALVAFLVVGIGVPSSVLHMGTMANLYREGQLGATHVESILGEPELAEPQDAVPARSTLVEFDSVGFEYTTGQRVLENISFEMQPGTVTAIVGPSGSGKTTLARLLPRFWDVTDGSIRLGGSDLRDQSSREVLRSMAIVFQDVVLLWDSVRENIRLGRPDATDLEVETAARRAQIHDVIMRLPDGYDTEIGGGSGGELSGGEKQRLTIARAILQNPPIVILDEATSQADPHSESAVQRALGEISADGGTLMVIAHRLHTVRYADQILVLDAGRIVEKGTHEQLSALGGTYARMWALQNPLVEDISPRKALQ
ncbi:ATP-binding cassette subfamily B protein [Rhodococcus erythropolis]|uniref:ABC transporter ATP-binding protein n=1 Tax=Rhodococcus TaxID=1827 RepID=UPI002167E8FB|nr:ABC transporter ATP-binding protein [Rhodococcus erythropolis]MCS4251735.1 ATP-binding cassette subfamily B protein [Rhodococcus erythropolis]MCW2427035.1 ATP-binding cassette subfamily B protein [Rhodococcus erythropolis]